MIKTLIRTAVLYFFVTFGIRLMGKRQIGDMQPNELVITLLISEIAAIPLQDTSQPLINGIVAVLILVILEIIISVLAMKLMPVRNAMSGHSAIIIYNGEIDVKQMKKVRLTVVDLIELLRSQGYFNIEEVAYAVLEVNGNLSVIPKTAFRGAQVKDLKDVSASKESLPLPVVSDGKIIKASLKNLNITQNDVIKKAGNNPIKDIFLMTLDTSGKTTIILKKV